MLFCCQGNGSASTLPIQPVQWFESRWGGPLFAGNEIHTHGGTFDVHTTVRPQVLLMKIGGVYMLIQSELWRASLSPDVKTQCLQH